MSSWWKISIKPKPADWFLLCCMTLLLSPSKAISTSPCFPSWLLHSSPAVTGITPFKFSQVHSSHLSPNILLVSSLPSIDYGILNTVAFFFRHYDEVKSLNNLGFWCFCLVCIKGFIFFAGSIMWKAGWWVMSKDYIVYEYSKYGLENCKKKDIMKGWVVLN